MRLALSLAMVGTLLTAVPLAAQGRGRPADSVPDAHKPPAGMCRIWLPNVPASKQAAPTDCPTAVRNRPANARVIFGDPLPVKRGERRDPMPIPLPLKPPTSKPKTPPPTTPPLIPPPA